MGPEFNELWNRYFKDKPDKPVMFGSIVGGAYADHTLLPPGKYITMFQYLEYPASRGKIHIKSTNPYVEPFFDSGFMNNKADFAPIRWSYKKTREVARRMDCEFYSVCCEITVSSNSVQASVASSLPTIPTSIRTRQRRARTLTSGPRRSFSQTV